MPPIKVEGRKNKQAEILSFGTEPIKTKTLITLFNIVNKKGIIDSKIYSTYSYDIKQNLDRGMLFPPIGGMFEIKFPNSDITGRAI